MGGLRWLGSGKIILVLDNFREPDCYTFLCELLLFFSNINAIDISVDEYIKVSFYKMIIDNFDLSE